MMQSYNECQLPAIKALFTYAYIRPGKVDLLFPISHFINVDVGGQSLFIIAIIRAPLTLSGAFYADWKLSPL